MPLIIRLILSFCALSASVAGSSCAIGSSSTFLSPLVIARSTILNSGPTQQLILHPAPSSSSSRNEASSWRLFGRRGGGGSDGASKEKKPSKSNLPEKICAVCGRPFTWRKKWERCWDEVTCCSKSCNSQRRSGK
ncbi:hypothetical protein ACHAXH_009771 [Discostella pseudostelligera]|jgi:hypothetical protein